MIKIDESELKQIGIMHRIEDSVTISHSKIKFNHMDVCVKQIKTESFLDANKALQEALTLASFAHPNVVKIYCSYLEGNDMELEFYSIIMEYFELRNLSKLIKERIKSNIPWSEATLLYYGNQLISALAYLQQKDCAHRDIKPENILVSNSGRLLKISDFGDCIKVIKNSLSLRGTTNYLSPILRTAYKQNLGDQIKTIRHNPFKSDVFSLGLILLYMATFKDPKIFERVSSLREDLNKCIESLGYNYSNLKILLRALLEIDEESRPDFVQLREEISCTHKFTENNFCIKCQNYLILTNFVKIYDTDYCDMCEQQIKSQKHKCLNCKKHGEFNQVYIFENKVYCKKCLSLKSLKKLPLYCSICRNDINENLSCKCVSFMRCKVCKLREHEGISCIINIERVAYFYNEALYKCNCGKYLENQIRKLFYYCNNSQDHSDGSEPELKSYCWVCGKSENKEHPLCRVLLEYSNYLN